MSDQELPSANPNNVIAILRNRLADEVVQRSIAEAAALEANQKLTELTHEITELRESLEEIRRATISEE